jgi:D-methionine transport system ATP-binding protein
VITLEHVSKVYRQGRLEIRALDDVSLQVERGEIFGVIGQSGAGKSTLIRCVNRLETPTAGRIYVAGREITALRGRALREARQKIGMIFQGFSLLSLRTVAGNVALPLEVTGMPRGARQERVNDLLGLVGLEGRAAAYPSRLSGGQKQRVGIARALAAAPDVLLSDEATSALDPETTATILDLLKRLNQQLGLTILLITHEMVVIKRICDRVALLEDGRVVEQGGVAELAAQPSSRLATALFPRPLSRETPAGAVRVTVSLEADQASAELLAQLATRFGVTAVIVAGSVEQVGGRRMGQLTLDIAGERAAEAVAWLRTVAAGVAA